MKKIIMIIIGVFSILNPTILVAQKIEVSEYNEKDSKINLFCNINRDIFDGMKINSGEYKNLWRHRNNSSINIYFMFSAMYNSNQFTKKEIENAVNTTLKKIVVGKRFKNTRFYKGMKVSIRGKIFEVNIAGVTSDDDNIVPHMIEKNDFIYDGSVVWEYLGVEYPEGWEYFLIDISNDLFTPIAVDSNDSYAAMLIAASGKIASEKWLNSISYHKNLTNIELLKKIAEENMEKGIKIPEYKYLSNTFQNNVNSNNQYYNESFLADNSEVYGAYKTLAKMFDKAGYVANSGNANYLAEIVKSGVVDLYDEENSIFKTYLSQSIDNENSCEKFVTDYRFHGWPSLYGMFNNQWEIENFVDNVYNYTVDYCPNLYNEYLDIFPLSEWFWIQYKNSGDVINLETLINRVVESEDNIPTIVDFSLALDSCNILN